MLHSLKSMRLDGVLRMTGMLRSTMPVPTGRKLNVTPDPVLALSSQNSQKDVLRAQTALQTELWALARAAALLQGELTVHEAQRVASAGGSNLQASWRWTRSLRRGSAKPCLAAQLEPFAPTVANRHARALHCNATPACKPASLQHHSSAAAGTLARQVAGPADTIARELGTTECALLLLSNITRIYTLSHSFAVCFLFDWSHPRLSRHRIPSQASTVLVRRDSTSSALGSSATFRSRVIAAKDSNKDSKDSAGRPCQGLTAVSLASRISYVGASFLALSTLSKHGQPLGCISINPAFAQRHCKRPNLQASSLNDHHVLSPQACKKLLLDNIDENADTIPAAILSGPDDAKSIASVGDVAVDADLAAPAAPAQGLPKYIADRVAYEGGEFVLLIGADASNPDSAEHIRFNDEELAIAIANVVKASNLSDADASVLDQRSLDDGSRSAHVLIRRIPASAEELVELRIAVIGNVDAGKSTMLGVLTKGGLDDGRGKARVNLFRHKHEVESGRTSSVGMEIMGFDSKGKPVHNVAGPGQEPGRKMSWEEVCAKSSKVISFIDLAGHERYLKTTVFGMTGCLPDFVMLMVGANAGLIGMSKEHLGIALALSVPVVVCITKIDMTPAHVLETTLKQLTKILKSPGCRKTPVFVNDVGQVVDSALRLESERICPIFQISNVTGLNLDLLRSFLNILPQASAAKFQVNKPFEFQISDIFSVPFVGTVVSGVVLAGSCKVGDSALLGPDSLGQFVTTSIRSIQRKRVNVDGATAGQSVSFALKKIRRNQVRKGMVMVARTDVAPKSYMEFDAEILCLYHSTTLSVGSCMVLHAASIRQTVRIVGIAKLDGKPTLGVGAGAASDPAGKPVVRTGDRAKLRLQFIRYPEYVKPGMKLITREGKTKLIGVVRAVGQTGPLGGTPIPTASQANVPPPANPAPALGVK
ncbi:hypothetical protein L1887_55799 [Cichorium endivia]|nr:hypothetical protein L1887_55799 [Cichorium endivia]